MSNKPSGVPHPADGHRARLRHPDGAPAAAARLLEEHAELLAQVRRDLEIQFRRIAEIQAELDAVKKLTAGPFTS